VPRVVVDDPHPRVAQRGTVRLGQPAEEELVGGAVGLEDHQAPDGVLQEHGHEAALQAAHEQDAARARGEQREQVAEGAGRPRVGEAADVLPARVEVKHLVSPDREVLVGSVHRRPQREPGGGAREPGPLAGEVQRGREGGERQAQRGDGARQPRAGDAAGASGGEGEEGRRDAEARREAQRRQPRPGEERDRDPAQERAERLDDVEAGDALARLPEPGGGGGEGGERPADGDARRRERRRGEGEGEAQPRQLAGARSEGEPQPPSPHDGERGQQGQERQPDPRVGGGVESAPTPGGRGPEGDAGEPEREPAADRGLVAGDVHDELAQQQHLRRGGEEAGREEGRVAHSRESTPRREPPGAPGRPRPGTQCSRFGRPPW
jgi:hypothetical protein